MAVTMRGVNTIRATLKGGRVTYYYHRASGRRLEGEPGSPEFIASYHEAEKALAKRGTGTLTGLIHDFCESADWRRFAETTRAEYKRVLRIIEDEYGSCPLPALEEREFRRDALRWRDKHAKKAPRQADYRIAVLARVLAWGADRGHLHVNVLSEVKRVYRSDRSELIWLPEHVETFVAVAPQEMQWALMLALHTGQRQGDLLRLTWNAYDGKVITLRQSKGGARVTIPCTKALRATLDAMPRRATVMLTTPTGRAWKSKHFQHRWGDVAAEAKIVDLHFHDLRGTAVTMLAEAGCTQQEIAAITGHSLKHVAQILDTYLARTRRLAENAIVKLETYLAKEAKR